MTVVFRLKQLHNYNEEKAKYLYKVLNFWSTKRSVLTVWRLTGPEASGSELMRGLGVQ